MVGTAKENNNNFENEIKKTSNQSQMLNNLIENKSSQSVQFEIIETGEQIEMKYRGITIHKHKTCNTWYARYRANGKQHYLSARTQQECYNKLKVALKKLEQKQLILLKEPKPKEPKTMSFIEWYEKWLNLYKQNVKETTLKDYKGNLNYLNSIKNMSINKITSINILELLNNINFERRKEKVYEFLKDIFKKATLNKIIKENPLDVIDKPKHKKVNGIAFSNEDEKKLESILIEQKLDMFLICLYQGLRRGEMMALTVEDIDFTNKQMTINKSINSNDKLDTTKNTYSNRTIPIFEKTQNILEKYKNSKGSLFKTTRAKCSTTFLKIIRENFPEKKYTIHSLRHTFITRCQEAGTPLHIIQKWVGHNIGSVVTNKVYTHTREVAELENIEKINVYMKKSY